MTDEAAAGGGDAGEQARAEAEARRKRIMEKSKARMDKVSGLQSEADAAAEEEGGTTKSSSAARMQAMRRRRFKKGQKAKEEAKDESAGAADATATGTSTSAEQTAKPDAAEASKPAGDTKEEEETPESKEEPKKEEPAAPKLKLEEETTTTTGDAPETTEVAEAAGTKKKYKGVAKMRREKMLQKKKEEAARAAEEEAKNPSSENPAVQARRKKMMKQPMLPILMYLLTTFMLFLAGLDIGLQHADESVLVNRDFAPHSFSIQKLNPWGGSSAESSNAPIKDLGSDTDYSSAVTEESDEFTTTKEENAAGDPNYVPNIDPLFRVDLDEYTRGPGVLNQLGRGAVKVHRMILYVLWGLPLQFFALPAQLMSFPPVMCLSALTIRQLFGKVVLGAKLPEAVEEDVRNNKEITDVLTMIKNAVKNTVVGLFPTAVSLYEGFQFLKTDMYVMLFGVFVGLLYSTWTISNEAGVQSPVGMEEPEEVILEDVTPDDVIPEPDPAMVEEMEEVLPVEDVTDGIADEL